jgi:ketosteroid isomerase-like protein
MCKVCGCEDRASEPGQVIEVFEKKFNSGDLEGLLRLYEDDAVVPAENGVLSGKAAIKDWLQAFLDTGAKLSFKGSAVFQTGDIALTHNSWSMGGDQPMEGVTAEVVRRQEDGSWKYIIDNPFGGGVLQS